MKLSLVQYKKVYSYEDLNDDQTIEEMLEVFLGIMKSAGYGFFEGDRLEIVNEKGL